MLEIRDLEVRYGAVPAVRGLTIEVNEGEIVGLIGPNGAGKSTTLLAVMGAARVRRGEIRVRGSSIVGARTEDIARSGVSLVPEGRHIFPHLTVDENLRLGLVGRRDRDGVRAGLDWVHGLFPVVGEFRHRPAGALSGGQQQQLAIARSLLADPELLLLDEPSLGLAPSIVGDLWDTLGEIGQRGVTILLVEQRAQITIELAARTYVMHNGEIRTSLTPADAGDTDRIAAAYFGAKA
ncbi:MAG: ATP-binding cassette domain-containing protein [Solirubrobacterales bacterium]|nr:ATP-binding cassette domain-containing protein [Solirubrobacterales bacterium]